MRPASVERSDDLTGIEIGEIRPSETREAQQALTIIGYDGVTIPFPDDSFDLVYATHVLEHVLDERAFLGELRRVSAKLVFIEVPCEITLRTSHASLQSTLDIGHINPYTPETLSLTLATSGLRAQVLQVNDVSLEAHGFESAQWKARTKSAIRKGLLKLSPTIASRLFSYHCAALCVK